MKNLVLKPLSSTSSNRVSKILRTLAGRSRRGSYCVAAPTEKCSVDTSCSCPTGSTKHSHTYGNETAAGTCHTCDTCPLKSTKCCNGNCIDSDYIQDGGKFAAVPTVGDYAHDFRNYCRTQGALTPPSSYFLFFFLLALLQTTIAETAATKHLHRLNVLLCANLGIQNAAMGNALAAAIYVTGKSARAPFLVVRCKGRKSWCGGGIFFLKKKDRKRGF